MQKNSKKLSSILPADSPPLSQPTISIIIPLYNAEEYIGECLDSVFLQTFQDFEIIVVDDCSTDNSVAIVESYIDKFNGRLRITKTKMNSGGGGYIPRNIGLNLANGEYVWFVDADDFILLNALETLYNAAKEYDADVVYTCIYYDVKNLNDVYLHKDGLGRKLAIEGTKDDTAFIFDDRNKIFNELLLPTSGEGNFRAPWSKFVRREFLIQNQISFPDIITGGDFIWCINVYAYAKKFLRLPIPLYFYRRYNGGSITRATRTHEKQISYWVSTLSVFLKALSELANKAEFLREHPVYCYEALKVGHFGWCLNRTSESRKGLSDQEIYTILQREFNSRNDLSDYTMPFLFSIIDADKKANEAHLQRIENLKKEIAQLKTLPSSDPKSTLPANPSSHPLVSVIIALYNAEKYIAECLESLLVQTFQAFEVIVVDDCSTDKSIKIVKSYAPKFNGRLRLAKMDQNSGSGGLPRNKGVLLSRGEYIQFLDSDDTLTKTALEEMYTLAKDYEADVVYCEKHYCIDADGSNLQIKIFQQGSLVDKPTFEPEDFAKRVDRVLKNLFVVSTCFKFVKRNVLIENDISFPHICPSEDDIWTYSLVFCAKKFLRVPNAVYIRRVSENSVMRKERTPQQTIKFWLNPVLLGLKFFDNFMSRREFFKKNPSFRYDLLKKFIKGKFNLSFDSTKNLPEYVLYSTIKDGFSEKLGDYDVLVSALCAALYNEKKIDATRIINKFGSYFTARIDIKLIPQKAGNGDFKITSVSDDSSDISKPGWLNKNGIGYTIQSYSGNLEFIAKATTDGQISLDLRGKDIRDPKDPSKRIPCWIDYTMLKVNGQAIFDTSTPAWHDASYHYNLDVKADEEIAIQIEWFPHRSDTTSTKEIAQNNQSEAEIEKLSKRIAELEKYNADCAQLIHNFAPYLTARIDIRQFQKKARGNFQIVSMSDDKANISKPAWIQKSGVGYTIESYSGKMEFVVTSTVSGNIQLDLRGKQIRDPMNKTKRVPYWIDYTLLIVNGHTVFDTLTPAWHDKAYHHIIKAVAGEEITIQVEWFPHRSDT